MAISTKRREEEVRAIAMAGKLRNLQQLLLALLLVLLCLSCSARRLEQHGGNDAHLLAHLEKISSQVSSLEGWETKEEGGRQGYNMKGHYPPSGPNPSPPSYHMKGHYPPSGPNPSPPSYSRKGHYPPSGPNPSPPSHFRKGHYPPSGPNPSPPN